jgi:hypothetical protein
MKFIILTRASDGKDIYVNPSQVVSICPYYGKATTIVHFMGTTSHEVLESVETVVGLCQIEELDKG